MAEPHRSLRLSYAFIGLLGAAAIAVFVTTYLTLSGVIVADVVKGASTDKLLEIINPLGWLAVLTYSILFGLPGAALFLGVVFWLCVRFSRHSQRYALAGILAGVGHACTGLLLRAMLGLDMTGGELDRVLIWGGGFLLAFWPRPETVFFLLPASMLAGWLAGRFFEWALRSAPTRHEDSPNETTAAHQ